MTQGPPLPPCLLRSSVNPGADPEVDDLEVRLLQFVFNLYMFMDPWEALVLSCSRSQEGDIQVLTSFPPCKHTCFLCSHICFVILTS